MSGPILTFLPTDSILNCCVLHPLPEHAHPFHICNVLQQRSLQFVSIAFGVCVNAILTVTCDYKFMLQKAFPKTQGNLRSIHQTQSTKQKPKSSTIDAHEPNEEDSLHVFM